MATKKKKPLLDQESLAAYSASLEGLTAGQIRQAKREYIENAIANFQNARAASRGLLVVLAIACLFPFFLVIFIPSLLGFWCLHRDTRRRLRDAVDFWEGDLGAACAELRQKIREA